MLPSPTLSFTIPSVHDDLVLQCRVYHPRCLSPTSPSRIQEWKKRAAVVAHPYAPLGGCYDDPVVDAIASTILNQDFIVGTFNFRGAGTSKGRTSWQSKAEQNDYISFVGFMIYYLHQICSPSPNVNLNSSFARLDPEVHDMTAMPSQTIPPSHSEFTSPITTTRCDDSQVPHRLLLAGYSYGAMITSSLPVDISSMIYPFQSPASNSAYAEIRMRAHFLADQQNQFLNSIIESLLPRIHRRGRSLQIQDLSNGRVHRQGGEVRMGGEENLRRASHELHRSKHSFTIETPEKLRQSLERVRFIAKPVRTLTSRPNSHGSLASPSNRKASQSEGSLNHTLAKVEVTEIAVETILPIKGIEDHLQVAYLLVSPLHGLVGTLATLWSSKSSRGTSVEPDVKLTVDPTLALFGDDDVFVSVKRLRTWAERLADTRMNNNRMFQYREVSGAGHFWHHREARRILKEEIKRFASSL